MTYLVFEDPIRPSFSAAKLIAEQPMYPWGRGAEEWQSAKLRYGGNGLV